MQPLPFVPLFDAAPWTSAGTELELRVHAQVIGNEPAADAKAAELEMVAGEDAVDPHPRAIAWEGIAEPGPCFLEPVPVLRESCQRWTERRQVGVAHDDHRQRLAIRGSRHGEHLQGAEAAVGGD